MKNIFAGPLKPFSQEVAERRSALGLAPVKPVAPRRFISPAAGAIRSILARNKAMMKAPAKSPTPWMNSLRVAGKAAGMERLRTGAPIAELAGFGEDSGFRFYEVTPTSTSTPAVTATAPIASVNTGSGAAPSGGFWGNLLSPLTELAKGGVELYKQKQQVKVAKSQAEAAATIATLNPQQRSAFSLSQAMPFLLLVGVGLGGYMLLKRR